MSANEKKARQLGMPFGTACNRLRKIVLYDVLKRHGENFCYRCGKEISSAEELSLEHKHHWLDVDVGLFWDISNIAFSHLSCNSMNSRPNAKSPVLHGTHSGYSGRHQCRCPECLKGHKEYMRQYRKGRSVSEID